MGNLCESSEYDVNTVNQRTVTIIQLCLYVAAEAYFIYLTASNFINNRVSKSDPYSVLVFVFAHCTLITTILYLIGGMACIKLLLYYFLDQTPILFYNFGVFALLLKLVDVLKKVDFTPVYSSFTISVLVMAVLHLICYIGFFTAKYVLNKNNVPMYHYLFFAELILFLMFTFFSWYLYGKYKEKFPSFKDINRTWFACNIIINVLLGMRLAFSINNMANGVEKLKASKSVWFSIYLLAVGLLTEVTPFLTLTQFMQLLSQKTFDRLVNESTESQLVLGSNMKDSVASDEEAHQNSGKAQ